MRAYSIVFAFLLLAAPATAEPPSWPITPSVDFSKVAKSGSAVVNVVVGQEAKAVDIQVYGQDGLKVGAGNKVEIKRDKVEKGGVVSFHVMLHPGPGRGYVVVKSSADFAHAGHGVTVRSFAFGKEDAAQLAEHSRCVRKDPDGVLIRLPDCDDPAPPAAATGVTTLTLKELASPPAGANPVQVLAYVVGDYFCPPCPPGAQCKPCMSASFISLAEPDGQPAAAKLAVSDPSLFKKGVRYRFEIDISNKPAGFVGTLTRSQTATGGAWLVEPPVLPAKP